MNKWIIILCISILLSMETAAQTNANTDGDNAKIGANKENDSTLRDVYLDVRLGLAGITFAGVGYQLNDDWAVGLKLGGYWQYDMQSGVGVGIKLSKRTHIKYINNLNLEFTPYYESSYADLSRVPALFKGYGLEINIGNEKIKSPGIYFTWQVGAVASFALHHRTLIMPTVNLGVNLNLF